MIDFLDELGNLKQKIFTLQNVFSFFIFYKNRPNVFNKTWFSIGIRYRCVQWNSIKDQFDAKQTGDTVLFYSVI